MGVALRAFAAGGGVRPSQYGGSTSRARHRHVAGVGQPDLVGHDGMGCRAGNAR